MTDILDFVSFSFMFWKERAWHGMVGMDGEMAVVLIQLVLESRNERWELVMEKGEVQMEACLDTLFLKMERFLKTEYEARICLFLPLLYSTLPYLTPAFASFPGTCSLGMIEVLLNFQEFVL